MTTPRLLAALFLAVVAVGFTPFARADDTPAASEGPDVGRHILAYERALLAAPGDGGLRDGLRDLRAAAGVTAPPRGALADATGWLSLDAWGLAGLGALALAAFLLLLRGARPHLARHGVRVPELSGRRLAAALVGLGLVVLVSGTAVATHASDATASVVVGGPASLHLSPFAEAAAAGTLPPGTRARVEKTFGDYAFVHAAPQRSGWVERASLEAICPKLGAVR